MFTQNVRRLYQPTVRRCCDCEEKKIAIACEIIHLHRAGGTQTWWLCRDCGRPRGIYATRQLSERLRRLERRKRSKKQADAVALAPSPTAS